MPRPRSVPRSAPLIALVAALTFAATPSFAPAQTLSAGRIEGTVVLSAALSTRRPRYRPYAERGQVSQVPVRAEDQDERRNVVVYLANAPGHSAHVAPAPAPAPAPAIRQTAERFEPHVLPIVAGATVAFPNDDAVYHNVFSLSSAKTFDLGRYPRGASRSVKFTKPGSVQVFCHIHGDMSAIVLVLENPFFTTPDDGRYALENVPPGEYTIIGWHERIRPVTRRVRVVAGETARVDFDIPLPLQAANR